MYPGTWPRTFYPFCAASSSSACTNASLQILSWSDLHRPAAAQCYTPCILCCVNVSQALFLILVRNQLGRYCKMTRFHHVSSRTQWSKSGCGAEWGAGCGPLNGAVEKSSRFGEGKRAHRETRPGFNTRLACQSTEPTHGFLAFPQISSTTLPEIILQNHFTDDLDECPHQVRVG